MAKRGKNVIERNDPFSALEGAAGDYAALAEEMREWADNMANANMDHLEKYEQVEAAADALESADLSELLDTLQQYLRTAERLGLPGISELSSVEVSWSEFRPYGKRGASRADRFDNATSAAQAGVEGLARVIDAIKVEPTDEDTPELDCLEDVKAAFEEIKQAVDELQGGVEFPGMYG